VCQDTSTERCNAGRHWADQTGRFKTNLADCSNCKTCLWVSSWITRRFANKGAPRPYDARVKICLQKLFIRPSVEALNWLLVSFRTHKPKGMKLYLHPSIGISNLETKSITVRSVQLLKQTLELLLGPQVQPQLPLIRILWAVIPNWYHLLQGGKAVVRTIAWKGGIRKCKWFVEVQSPIRHRIFWIRSWQQSR